MMFKTKKTRSESENGPRTFTSSDVSRIAQVSLRQLQWWDERKVVSPQHEGHKRVYHPCAHAAAKDQHKGYFAGIAGVCDCLAAGGRHLLDACAIKTTHFNIICRRPG